jgi:hypothetical protein
MGEYTERPWKMKELFVGTEDGLGSFRYFGESDLGWGVLYIEGKEPKITRLGEVKSESYFTLDMLPGDCPTARDYCAEVIDLVWNQLGN